MTPVAPEGDKPSLYRRLVRHVLLPLALTWGLGSIVVLSVGNHFAAQAFDRALLDDAHALAAHVRLRDGQPELDLSPQEMSTLLFDQSEDVHFAVYGAGGRRLAGEPGLPVARIPEGAAHVFSELQLDGKLLRSVSLRLHEPVEFVAVMAQTTASRTALLRQLLLYSAVVQLWLLVALAWWLNRIIARDLRPLSQLQQAVDQRDAGDLAPLPATLTQGASTRDVQRLGDAVNSLLSRLSSSLGAQREFAGNVAHELRTPLAGIRTQATYALSLQEGGTWRGEVEGILQAQERASRLVDQLLALARADEGSAALALGPLALNALVRELVLRFLPRADTLGVDLGGEGLDEVVEVRGDPALVEGILNNLLDNALRYGTGAAAPRVTVSLRHDARGATLCVVDNGPGLGAAQASEVTRRWAQGDQGQKLGQGAGLGLSIVRRYAELMGAQLQLANGPHGAGLQASVWFPSGSAARA